MRNHVLFSAVIILIGLVNGGGCNVFTELSSKTSDEAIVDDVNNLMDKGFWTDAVNKWNLLTSTGKAKRANKLLLASALAGRGGLDIVTLITNMNTNASGGSKTFFQQLMIMFNGRNLTHYNDEVSAQNIIFGIAPSALNRTADENIFLVFVEFAKMGTLFAAIADVNADAATDATFDNCNTTVLTTTQANEVVVSIAAILTSLAATGSAIAGTSLTAINSACTTIEILSPGFCSSTDISQVTALQTQASRTLVGETALGVGLKAALNAGVREFPPAGIPCP